MPQETPGWAGRVVAAGVLLAATAATYHAYLPGCFVLDDFSSVVENHTLRQLWPPSSWWSPPAEAGTGGRPLANFTLALNYAVSGLDPWGFHAGNIFLHFAAALALFGLVDRTLRQPTVRLASARAAAPLALAVATLWTVHPLTSSAVGYVAQRTELLMALCFLIMLYAVARHAESGSRRWAAAAIAAGAAGMASKEVMAVAPLVALLYDRTFFAGSFRAAWQARGRLHTALCATWVWLGWLMFSSHLPNRGIGFGQGMDLSDNVLVQAQAVLRYLRLAWWPDGLVFDYGWSFGGDRPQALLALAGCVAIVGATLWAVARRPTLGFAAAWVLLILAPTSTFIPIVQQPVAESRMYLPLAGIVAAVVLGAYRGVGRRLAPVLAGSSVLGLGLGWLTFQRGAVFQSEIGLWADTLAHRPASARAHGHLAAALLRANRLEESAAASAEALRLHPRYPDARVNLGVALERLGRNAEAASHFEAALRDDSNHPEAHYNLGLALARTGRVADATRHFEATLRRRPEHAAAHNNLAVTLLSLGRADDAAEHARSALRRQPGFAEAHYNLGNALARQGNLTEALAAFESAVRADPRFAKAHNNLGVIKLRLGQPEAARAHFEAALRLDPSYAEARRNLAAVTGR
jgi:tetratricopeptide (TPR) repeat protein